MPLDNRGGVTRISHDPNLKKDFYDIEPEIKKQAYFQSTNGILVAWGLPAVPVSKYKTFKQKVILKSLKELDVVMDETANSHIRDFYMPIDGHEGPIDEDNLPATGKTLGMFFIEFYNEEQAAEVLVKLDGKQIQKKKGKKSVWHVMRFSEWQAAQSFEEEFKPPSLDDFKSSNSTRAWLEDPEGRDQFMVRYKDGEDHKCAVYWGDHRRGGAVLASDFSSIKKKVLTNKEAEWSPLGSYILTRHGPGMKTYVQNRTGEWIADAKFEHESVDYWDISPNEKYLVTWSSDDNPELIQFWELETGLKQRPFTFGALASQKMGIDWPFFKWSHDDQYFAWIQSSKCKKKAAIPDNLTRADADRIVIFSTEDFRRLDKSSYNCKNVKVMEFCPSKHLLVYVTSASLDHSTGNETIPTAINILTVPQKELKVSYPQVLVHRVNLFWHSSGDYLCAAIIKRKKKKKKSKSGAPPPAEPHSFSLCIFHTAHKHFPRQTIDLGKDPVKHIVWEPTDTKICVLQDLKCNQYVISVYEFGYDPNNPIKYRLFNNPDIPNSVFTSVGDVSWSPMGRYLCLNHENGNRTFFDTQKLKRPRGKDKVKMHDSAEDLYWSPCGRFVVSTVCTALSEDDEGAVSTDNAWVMYNFQGDDVARQEYKGVKGSSKCLFSFTWRPRPKSLFTEEQKADVSSRLRDEYWEKFYDADLEIISEQTSAQVKEFRDREKEWSKIKEVLLEKAVLLKKRREEIRGCESEDEADFEIEDVMEEMRIEVRSSRRMLTPEELDNLKGTN